MPPPGEPLVAAPASLPFLVVGTPPRALAFPAEAVQRAIPRNEYEGLAARSLARLLAQPEREYAADWVLMLVHGKDTALAVRGPLRVLQVLAKDVLPLPRVISDRGLYTAVILRDSAPVLLVLEPHQTLMRAAGHAGSAPVVSES